MRGLTAKTLLFFWRNSGSNPGPAHRAAVQPETWHHRRASAHGLRPHPSRSLPAHPLTSPSTAHSRLAHPFLLRPLITWPCLSLLRPLTAPRSRAPVGLPRRRPHTRSTPRASSVCTAPSTASTVLSSVRASWGSCGYTLCCRQVSSRSWTSAASGDAAGVSSGDLQDGSPGSAGGGEGAHSTPGCPTAQVGN